MGPKSTPRVMLPVVPSTPPPPHEPVTTCQGCGICCTEQSLPPFLDEIDFAPPDLQREVLEARKHEADFAGQPCIWWDRETKKCKHHEDRPNICREFEVGGDCCLEIRARLLNIILW